MFLFDFGFMVISLVLFYYFHASAEAFNLLIYLETHFVFHLWG
jgi:hypothetical protein